MRLDEATVESYREAMENGANFPAVVVFAKGEVAYLADGFHRLEATRRANLSEILAEVREGELRDAILYSVGANATHGLPRTHADKRRAVLTLLADPDWGGCSNRWIAQQAAVDHKTVARWRAEVESSGVGQDPAQDATGEFPQSTGASVPGVENDSATTGEIPQSAAEGAAAAAPARSPRGRLGRDGRVRKARKPTRPKPGKGKGKTARREAGGSSRADDPKNTSSAADRASLRTGDAGVDGLVEMLVAEARGVSPADRLWLTDSLSHLIDELRRRLDR